MSTSIGKVTINDGSFSQDGKKTNLSTLMTNLMFKRVQSVDGVLGGMINEMNKNNVTTHNMNNFLNGLRELRPTNSDDKVTWKQISDLENKVWNEAAGRVWPNSSWGLDLNAHKTMNQNQIDQLIEVMKSKISSVNSNQQMEQIKLEKYNNVRNESMQLASTMMKMQTQALQNILSNMS